MNANIKNRQKMKTRDIFTVVLLALKYSDALLGGIRLLNEYLYTRFGRAQ